jgi:hypothetical protein
MVATLATYDRDDVDDDGHMDRQPREILGQAGGSTVSLT